MLKRAINSAGLVVGIAELKARLAALSARRSAVAGIGYVSASLLAMAGLCGLFGAGYIVAAPFFGAAGTLAIIGVVALVVSGAVALAARKYGRSHDPRTASALRECVANDERSLRVMLGLEKPGERKDAGGAGPAPSGSGAVDFLNDPKVMLSAGFATAGLLGPARLLRMVRFATAAVTMAGLVNRAAQGRTGREVPVGSDDGSRHMNGSPRGMF